MFRRCLTVIVILALCASPAQGQFVVIDPGNLAQAILIAERTLRHYDELRRQYETILRMGQGLGNMDGYRIPSIAITSHDPSRWLYGREWIQGLNSGDATGASVPRDNRAPDAPDDNAGTAHGRSAQGPRAAVRND